MTRPALLLRLSWEAVVAVGIGASESVDAGNDVNRCDREANRKQTYR